MACGRCCGAPGAGAEGNGCLGPESTWPGRGVAVGSGFAAGTTGRPGAKTAAGGVCDGVSGRAGAGGAAAGRCGCADADGAT
ncbi:MAG: hypothetical protein JWP63_5386, partial [Candidatus Solibacter sp.]|nr:hypothetical protein [Candidatus Solibacter sp.]